MLNVYKSKPSKVLDVIRHTKSEKSFYLKYHAKNEPGKFVMVSLPEVGEIPLTISGFRNDFIELTIRNAGKVTSHIFDMEQEDHLYIRGPYGNVFPVDKFLGGHLMVIAGGTGIAAIKSLVEYFHRPDSCALKQLDILVGFRSPKHILFRDEFKKWQKWSKKCNVVLTVDTEDDDEAWLGGIGFVVKYVKHVKELGENTHCVVVGPPKMMINTIRELFLFGVKPENVWLSFERHMKCGIGKCGHCRIRDKYVCTDGPVFNYIDTENLLD